jgi:hypothetical protein
VECGAYSPGALAYSTGAKTIPLGLAPLTPVKIGKGNKSFHLTLKIIHYYALHPTSEREKGNQYRKDTWKC